MSDPERVPPSGGPGHWRRWLLPVLASAAWLVLTFCLYRHAVQGEQATCWSSAIPAWRPRPTSSWMPVTGTRATGASMCP